MADQDQTTPRFLQTREGIAEVPRSQEGIPFKDYFRNTQLPEDIETAVVFATEKGPILARPDPVVLGPEHDARAKELAEKLEVRINEDGKYRKTLNSFSKQLAQETGHPQENMENMIVGAFSKSFGKEVFDYLQDYRESRGLPVSERTPRRERDFGPEMS